MEKGSEAVKDDDLDHAIDCFSRALTLRVAHFGELAPECAKAYYKYGCALLYKAQDEADTLGAMPKKEDGSQQDSEKGGSVKNATNGESSVTCVESNAGQDEGSGCHEGAEDAASSGKDEEEDREDHDDDEKLAEVESDLDTAWKMLDIARVIVEKHSCATKEKVDILSKLAEVSLEREEFETALSDYKNTLSILEQVAEPEEYELDKGVQQSATVSHTDMIEKKKEEMQTLAALSIDLEGKLEDLQQLALNPESVLSEILGIASAKAKCHNSAAVATLLSSQMAAANNSGSFDSPIASTARTNGASAITHLGGVGRGVRRMHMNSGTDGVLAEKKPTLDSNKSDCNPA